jgi:site-specific DNA recombinase
VDFTAARKPKGACAMKAIGYIRVSTDEQATDGVSLEIQRAKVEAYAALYGLELVAIVEDAGVSARTLDRPGLRAALGRLGRGEAEGLVIAKLDRLSRSVGDWDVLIRDHFGERAGRQLWSVGDSIDTRTAAGRLVLNVLMSVAQWEREVIAERTREALRHKRERGERTGGIPFGCDLDADGVRLVASVLEVAAVGLMRLWRADGLSYRAIAGRLDAHGIPTKAGRPWAHTTVAKLLARDPDRPIAPGPHHDEDREAAGDGPALPVGPAQGHHRVA